jgi:hypothetical protein
MTTSPTGVLPSGIDTSCAARHGKGEAIQPPAAAYGHPDPDGLLELLGLSVTKSEGAIGVGPGWEDSGLVFTWPDGRRCSGGVTDGT